MTDQTFDDAKDMCRDCGEIIAEGEERAYGRGYILHRRCFKRGTAHGRVVKTERCENCGANKPVNDSCFQCGGGFRVGAR